MTNLTCTLIPFPEMLIIEVSAHKLMAMSSQGTDGLKKCYNLRHCTAQSYWAIYYLVPWIYNW